MSDDIQRFYDRTAERTADEWYGNDLLLPTIRELLELLPTNPRILDLGCGPGHESLRIRREGAEVLGIDFSPECIRIARERCSDCRFEVMDFTKLDARYGFFDAAFACASLVHVDPETMGKVLENIASVLQKDGFFLAIVREGEGIDEAWSDLSVDGEKFRRTFYLYTLERLTELCQEHGLRFVRESFLDDALRAYGWRSLIFNRSEA